MSCLIGTIAKSLLSESEDWSFTNAIEYAHTLPHHATSVTKVDCFTVAASRRVVGSPGSAVVHDEAYGAVCGVDGLLAQRESSELVQEIDHALFSGYFQALAQKGMPTKSKKRLITWIVKVFLFKRNLLYFISKIILNHLTYNNLYIVLSIKFYGLSNLMFCRKV